MKVKLTLPGLLIVTSIVTGTLLSALFIGVLIHSNANSSFTFAAAGDWGNSWNSTGETRKVVSSISGSRADFVVALGDFAYSDDPIVAESWCNNFKSIFSNVVVISGNHESGENNKGPMDVYSQHCPFPNIGVNFIPGTIVDDHGTSYGYEYAFDYPASRPIARFILLVPNVEWKCCGLSGNFSYAEGSQNYNWVSDRIDEAKSRGEWVILGWHKDTWSSLHLASKIWTGLEKLMFLKHVDLVMVGHDHVYERTYQLKCGYNSPSCFANRSSDEYERGQGLEYVIQGTGGFPILYSVAPSPLFVDGRQSGIDHGFMRYTISASSLSGRFVSVDSSFTDSFTITSATQSKATIYPGTAILYGFATIMIDCVSAGRARHRTQGYSSSSSIGPPNHLSFAIILKM